MTNGDDTGLRELERQLADAKAIAASAHAPADAELVLRERSAVRTVTTRIVVGLYAGIMALTTVYFLSIGFVTGDHATAAAQIFDLVKTALIPIVTFVIGHYFGSSSR